MFKNSPFHKSELLEINLFKEGVSHIEFILKVKDKHSFTDYFPKTINIVKSSLPSVLKTKCFNENNLPFSKEIKSTAFGHLFEHLALDYACINKVKKTNTSAKFSGYTEWNWNKFPEGSFLIHFNLTKKDHSFLKDALKSSVKISEKILRS